MHACQIIGVLDNGVDSLTPQALQILQQADFVIGATRTLALFAPQIKTAETKDLTGHLRTVADWIQHAQQANKKVVVLATGDPLCYGIASFLIKKLGKQQVAVISNVSTIALAFAKFSIAWQDAKIISIHKQDTGEWQQGAGTTHGLYSLVQAILTENKLAILTSPENNPARIARLLIIEHLATEFEFYIAQDLLTDDEILIQGQDAETIAKHVFNGNNVVILQRKQPHDVNVLFGLSDESFKQRKPDKGLITKREVRAVSLARMQLTATSIVWDIGAGSGAVGLEAARLCTQGHVYAIEKNTADFAIAQDNAQQLNIHNYQLIHAKAPDGLAQWENPDAVFIGGSAGELADLIQLCLQRLQENGWLVMNFVTLENLNTAVATLKTCEAIWDVVQLQASRSQPILHMNRLRAENPVWIISVQRGVK
jgi:precorrin-6Y C5,15-methyltransferase (decarboxylating)